MNDQMRNWMKLVEAVYHGSPHTFPQFSNDKIGSGEGQQAYGWGLYFAGNKEVAEWYRRTLTASHAMKLKPYRMIGDMPDRLEREVMQRVNQTWTDSLRRNNLKAYWLRDIYTFYNMANDYVSERDRAYYEEHGDEIERKITAFEQRYRDDPDFRARYHEFMGADAKPDWSHLRHPFAAAYQAASNELDRQLTARGYSGNLYSVEIPTDDEFLLWDNPMSEQPEPVKTVIAQMGPVDEKQTGKAFYRAVTKQAGSPKAASLLLASRGIVGIRYLDGSSRGRGYGHHNYVVFDDTRVSVTEARTGSFEKWFANSRVVDAAGRPLVVYHGTNQTFDRFSKKRGGMATGPQAGAKHGFFFTSDRAEAEDYAKNAGSKVVAGVSAFEKETERLHRESDRLERIAQRTGRREDWAAYERAYQEWETFEIDATQEDSSTNVQVIAAYLSLQNPLEANFNGGLRSEHGVIEDVVAKARRDGHDGVIMRSIADSPYGGRLTDQYVAFSPKQIRQVR